MKVLILAGGRGKRLNQVSEDKNKCMFSVKDKPLIEYSLNCAINTNASQIIIVVGYKAEGIINTFGNKFHGKPIEYAIQPEQKGLVHAIECAREAIGEEDFMLMLGDELLINPNHQDMIELFEKEKLFGVCGVVMVNNKDLITKTYAITQDNDGRMRRLIEKPLRPINNIMGTGNCIFRNEILSYINRTPVNPKRGERELPDLIQCAIDDNNTVKSFVICDRYTNINSEEEIKNLNSYFAHL